jgi:hypothetical protein
MDKAMTTDEIKALVERYGRSMDAAGYADETDMGERHRAEADKTYVEISAALTTLSDQLLAKTALADLYAASLRQSEAEVEGLKTARSSEITEAEIDAACSAYFHEDGTLREVMRAVIAAARRAARSQIDKEKP